LLTHSSGHDRKSLLDWFGQFRENGIQARDFGLPLSYRRGKGHSRDPILDCVYETLERLAGLFACCLRLRKQPGSLIESALQFSRQAVGDVSQCSWPEEFALQTCQQVRIGDLGPNGEPIRTGVHAVAPRPEAAVSGASIAAGDNNHGTAACPALHETREQVRGV
jgi:hypothetical protein